MIGRNDVIDALKVLSAFAPDKTPNPDDAIIMAHLEYTRPHPSWTGDDWVAAAIELNKRPRERLVQPADLGLIVRAAYDDRLARMDPDERDRAVRPDLPRDEFGYVDKSTPDAYVPQPNRAQRRSAAREEARKAFAESREEAPRVDISGVNVRAVRCEHCHASPGDPCTSPGLPGRPREVMKLIVGHPSRIIAAAVEQGFTLEQALAMETMATRRSVTAARKSWQPEPVAPNAT